MKYGWHRTGLKPVAVRIRPVLRSAEKIVRTSIEIFEELPRICQAKLRSWTMHVIYFLKTRPFASKIGRRNITVPTGIEK